MRLPLVITVILNTNRRADTLECLTSLKHNSYPNHRIMVLDNASTDGSVEAIRAEFPDVQVLQLTSNTGYAGNNNVGITEALAQDADWVLVLNEDTILAPDCISAMVTAAEQDPSIGVVGPLVYHHDEPTVIQSAGGSLGPNWEARHLGQNEDDRGQYATTSAVAWVSGCAILVRREAIEQYGMLDERFFYYWEEVEWCLRLGRAGWKILHVPAAKLWHKGVQRNYAPKPSVAYYNTRNRFLMLEKLNAPLTVRLGTWMQILRTLASYTIRPKWRTMRAHRDAQWRGMLDFLRRRWGQAQL
jgi:GT2 family glycosyltransferase